MGNMKKYKSLVIVVVLIVVGASCTPLISGHTGDLTKVQDTSIKEDFDCKYSNDFIPGEIIVKFKSGISPEIRTSERILKTGITSIDTLNEKFKINNVDKIFKNTKSSDVYGLSNFYKFVFPENSDIFSLIEEYQMDPNVEFVGPNPIMSAYLQPNDPYYYSSGSWEQDYQDLWGLHKINVSAAWNITTGSNDIVVAVIDTGIDTIMKK